MFIHTEHGEIALRTVVRITHSGPEGHQYAVTDDGKLHRVVDEDEVLRVTGTIVPASPGQVAYLVFYNDEGGCFQLKDYIIAWRIGTPWTLPITATYGFGTDLSHCDGVLVYQRADGKFEDPGMRTYDSIEAVEQELISRNAGKTKP